MERRRKLQIRAAFAMIIVGSLLLIAGFIVPPSGQIDSSVLVAFGETLTFAGALFGIDWKYKNKNYEKD